MKLESRLPIFRSPEQERLLAVLFVYADAPVTLSELSNLAGTSLGGAHKEVERPRGCWSDQVNDCRTLSTRRAGCVFSRVRRAEGTSGERRWDPRCFFVRHCQESKESKRPSFLGRGPIQAETNPADIDVLVVGEPDVAAIYDAAAEVEAETGRPVNVTIRSPAEWKNANGGVRESGT